LEIFYFRDWGSYRKGAGRWSSRFIKRGRGVPKEEKARTVPSRDVGRR